MVPACDGGLLSLEWKEAPWKTPLFSILHHAGANSTSMSQSFLRVGIKNIGTCSGNKQHRPKKPDAAVRFQNHLATLRRAGFSKCPLEHVATPKKQTPGLLARGFDGGHDWD